MNLIPIPARSTAVDACEQILRSHLFSGVLQAGEHLPAERTLADTLGVDRGTLRQAIGRLVTQGLLSAQQGRGTVVQDLKDHGSLELLAPLCQAASADPAQTFTLARDLLRLRRHLAAAVLEHLVDMGPLPDDALVGIRAAVAALHEAWGTHAAGVHRGDAAAIAVVSACDIDVLAEVVHATGSTVLSLAVNPVRKAVAACPPLMAAVVRDVDLSLLAWDVVTGFLQAPDATFASAILDGLRERDARTLEHLRPGHDGAASSTA
jgi:DNA-binding FadR family transcriptional regulator